MSDTIEAVYERLRSHVRETALLVSTEALLNWDERTIMPDAAGAYRAEQISFLAGLIHDRQCDPRVGQWLSLLRESPLADDPESDLGATVRELARQYDRRTRLPKALVLELSRSGVLGQQAWQHARKANDFGAFRPHLERMFQLKREEAEALGYGESPYDALLEDFEPAENTANLTGILGGLRDELVPLVAAIRVSGRRPRTDVLDRHYPIPAQEAFSRRVATAVGFSFDRGRLDVSAHPFCSEMGPFDCRLTTRYSERHFPSAFFGTLHEVGHGLYEQGLREDEYGLPLGHYVSLGIHESQSRMWENLVGRSRGFWRGWYAEARQTFPEALGDVPESDFFFAVNSVEPSLIRVEADEATYNLHILIRFELEQALLSGDLPVDDLPSAWNAKYRDYLGIQPTSDADGVLQDIHWSAGLIGYFPTYSLGNMYAAQFFDRATAELGDLEADFARRESHRLLDWLQKNIHRMGQRVPASELVRKVTGRPLSHAPLIDHLKRKLGPLYGL